MINEIPIGEPPVWLMGDIPGQGPLPLRDLLDGSVYYPACGFDGDPVRILAGNFYSFVYVDSGVEASDLVARLHDFRGYAVVNSREVPEDELVPAGWTPIPPNVADYIPSRALAPKHPPFGVWAILEQTEDYGDAHGPERFSLLYIGGDGVATFQALYHGNDAFPAVIAIVQPGTGWGGNWTDFEDQHKILGRSVLDNPAGVPTYLLHGGLGESKFYSNPCWPVYRDRIWREHRPNRHLALWRRQSIGSNQARRNSMQWCLQEGQRLSLQLLTADQSELDEVNAAVLELREAPHEQANTFSERVDDAILDGIVTPQFLGRLGAWCDAQGPRLCGREPARRAANAMFGRVVPRHDNPLHNWFLQFCREVEITACGDDVAVGQVGQAARGSRLCIQRYVNEAPQELADLLIVHSPSLSSFGPVRVDWHAPLAADDYYEFRDDILNAFGLAGQDQHRQQFWPAVGPQWDSLASVFSSSGQRGCLLIEAKAHLNETTSHCGATNPASIARITESFATVQRFMGVRDVTPDTWMQGHYQMANRLAFLYLFNEVLKIPTWLAFVNFVDDRSHIPTSLQEWRAHWVTVFRHLGLHPGCRLIDRVVAIFPRPLEPNN